MAGSGKGWPQSERALMCMKYFLYTFNVISFLVAVTVLTLGLWARYDWDFKHYIYELRLEHFWTGIYVLIAAASITMAVSLIGCFGAVVESPRILFWFGCILAVAFILEIAGVTYLLTNGTLWSNVTWWLRDRFYELIYVSDTDAREARILRILQEEIGCCGSYSSLDYINVNKPVPTECRDKATGNEYLDGCYIRISRYLEERSGWIAGVGLLLAVLQVIGILVTFSMRRTLIKLESDGKIYGPVKKSRA